MSKAKVGLLALMTLSLVLAGCPSDDENAAGRGDGDGGTAGAPGDDTGPSGNHKGGSSGGGNTSTPSVDGGGPAGGSGGGTKADAGVDAPGNGGSGSTVSPELASLCDDIVKLQDDQVAALGCSGNDSAAQRRLCEISGSCMKEMRANYDCKKAASTWSCDTTDGHPQTNGACETSEKAFFACLQTAVHEEDPFGCAKVAAARNGAADALGCDADMMLEGTCGQLYLRDLCLSEWSALGDCLDAATKADELECDADNALAPKGDTCATELDAFDTCLKG